MDRYFIDERHGSYLLHDRRGRGHSENIGVFYDAETAQRIVALLNADEEKRRLVEYHGKRFAAVLAEHTPEKSE